MNQGNNSKSAPDSDDSTVKIYEGVAECTMNDSDNLKSIKLRAKNLAQENVQNKIADYICSFLKDKLLTLPYDEILSIATEISNITDVKYNVFDSDDNLIVRAAVTAQIDDKDIMDYIVKCFQERAELKSQNDSLIQKLNRLEMRQDEDSRKISSLESENEALRKENEVLKRHIDELEQKSAESKSQNQIKTQTQTNKTDIKSKEDLACELFISNDFIGSLRLYNELIKVNPNKALYYSGRSNCYEKLGEHSKAQADMKKYEELR